MLAFFCLIMVSVMENTTRVLCYSRILESCHWETQILHSHHDCGVLLERDIEVNIGTE